MSIETKTNRAMSVLTVCIHKTSGFLELQCVYIEERTYTFKLALLCSTYTTHTI